MIIIFIILNLFFYCFSILPNWDLASSSKNLLSGTDTYTYTISNRDMNKLKTELKKTIKRLPNGTIVHSNYLYLNSTDDTREVDFEVIESFYKLNDGRQILCPKGKNEPINLNDLSKYENEELNKNKNWDLKCYCHNSGYFFIIYISHGENQVYDLVYNNGESSYIKYDNLQFYDELYDFKLVNREETTELESYPFCALVKMNNYIQFIGTEFILSDKSNVRRRTDLNKPLIESKEYSLGYFSNYSNDFYYITYNDVNDFSSGYSTSTVSGNSYYSNNVEVNNNYTSPFSFLDEVEIKEINFLLYTNYVYYSIYNENTGKTYHGILDVKLNKVLFNTDEDIDVFIPYSTYSMLAITKETAYEICIIKDDTGNCIDECATGEEIIAGVYGNQCGNNCPTGKYLLIPEGICVSECNSTLYVIKDNYFCGLCKDLYNSQQYKFTTNSECLTQQPENTHFYISKYNLLECNNGYSLNGIECIPLCYDSCETCSDYSQDITEQKCLTCKDGYYLENTPPSNCLFNCIGDSKEKCLTCNEESNNLGLCLTCKDGYLKVNYIFLKYYDCLKPDNPILKKYFYYNETLEEYRPCYKTCKSCIKEGDAEGHYCLECKYGYMFRPGNNPKNNCVAYSKYYYITPYEQYKPINVFQCPEEAKYMIIEKNYCIYNCQKDDTYKYLFNGNCLEQCPSDTYIDNFVCKVDSNKCTFSKKDIYLDLVDINLDVIETQIKIYLSEFNFTKKHISQYNHENYTIIIYIDSNCIKELDLEMPYIDFQTCYEKVKEAYNIEEDLVISIVDMKTTLNPNTFYSFYHPKSGKKLDAFNICKDIMIVVEENLNIFIKKDYIYFDTQISLINQGINIFDKDDPFFTDICYDFDNPLKKDIILNDRTKYLYQKAFLCGKGCNFIKINLENMTATCNCSFNDILNNELTQEIDSLDLDYIIGEIYDLINVNNFLLFKCIKNAFKHFTSSIGSWIILILIIVQIVIASFYCSMDLPKIKKYIYSVTKIYLSFLPDSKKENTNFPPKKKLKFKKIKNKKINEEKNYLFILRNISNNIINENKLNKNKKVFGKINRKNKKMISFSTRKELNLTTGENETHLTLQKENLDEKKKEFFKKYFPASPDDMKYENAIYYDKRKFCEYFVECIKEKQIIFYTFIAHDNLRPRIIKIIYFVLNLSYYFVFNGLFFGESAISDLLKVTEKENFFSFFLRSYKEIILDVLTNVPFDFLVDLLLVEEKNLKDILKNEKDDQNILNQKINQFIKYIQIRNIVFIIISFIILFFSFFFLLCFNYVYPYSQIEWIKSSITIVIMAQLFSIFINFLRTCLRFLSLNCKVKCLYKKSQALQ